MTKTIRLLRTQNNYLFKARGNTKSEFNFLLRNSTTFQVLLKLKTGKCELSVICYASVLIASVHLKLPTMHLV